MPLQTKRTVMLVKDFDFDLPEEMIARTPSERRDLSRLLVLKRDGSIEHRRFREITYYLQEGDLLILNNSKVIPARLRGRKPTGGRLEILLVKRVSEDSYEILSRGRYSGKVFFEGGMEAEIIEGRIARFASPDISDYIQRYGLMPLPPYIKRDPTDKDRQWYQTVYAEKEGSIAAPTAGLHFTEDLLHQLNAKGVKIGTVTLHVGIGTFKPIKTEIVQEHTMDAEEFEVSAELLQLVSDTKREGKRVIAVGTTVTRTLEAVISGHYHGSGKNGSIRGYTDLFIYPGYEFKAIDGMITNFHLPRSTPLMLVSALVGKKMLLNAYNEAIRNGYRFFSYGDAMLIL